MRPNALAALLVATAATSAALAQVPPATTKTTAPPAATAPPAQLKQVLATVNGESITRADLINFLSQYRIPLGDEQQNRVVYNDALQSLINNRLLYQFLARQRLPVPEEKVNERIAELERQLKQDGTDLATELLRNQISREDIHREMANQVRWVEYLDSKATDATLKAFADAHKDLFSGAQVRARHIMLRLEPAASAADKEQARQKLMGIKKDIEAKTTTFAEAANKYSQDPANADGAGGDVGLFGLNTGFIEEFASVAFSLPVGKVSDVVETPYGLHLIEVTERREGARFDFEQDKPRVKRVYAADLQKQVLTAERKTAKIDIKPMPTDLFPAAPAAAPASGAAPAPAPAPSPTPADATKKGAPK